MNNAGFNNQFFNPSFFNMNNPLFLQYLQQMNLMSNSNPPTNNKITESKPMDLKFCKDLTNDSISFTVYKSINDNFYLVYSNKNNSIISYDLIDDKKTIEIKNGHYNEISFLRHYLDKNNKRDLILSMATDIKVWNCDNFKCLLNLKNIYGNCAFLSSACFIKDLYYGICIIPTYVGYDHNDKMKTINLYGNKIKEINSSNEYALSIETFYDEKRKITYIITTHYQYLKSYDYEKNEL